MMLTHCVTGEVGSPEGKGNRLNFYMDLHGNNISGTDLKIIYRKLENAMYSAAYYHLKLGFTDKNFACFFYTGTLFCNSYSIVRAILYYFHGHGSHPKFRISTPNNFRKLT